MKKKIELEISSRKNVVMYHSTKITDSTLLHNGVSETVFCNKRKGTKHRLELWQVDTKMYGLQEW